MTDKQIKDPCDKCDVELPAMKFKCPECEHNLDNEQIIIDGIDVSVCKHYKINGKCRIPHYQQGIKYVNCNCNEWDCYFKQSAHKTQECEKLKSQVDEDYNYYTTELKTLRDIISNKEKRNAALSLTSGRYSKALDEIEKELKEGVYCESQECGCDDFEECLKCTKEHILDIINKAKKKQKSKSTR